MALECDVEMGGTDQKFNLLVGREIQKDFGQPPQIVAMTPILEGLDGVNKMSKSLGNYIGIIEPPEVMFRKVMQISDDLMWRYYELLTDVSLAEIAGLRAQAHSGELQPDGQQDRAGQADCGRFSFAPRKPTRAADTFNRVVRQQGKCRPISRPCRGPRTSSKMAHPRGQGAGPRGAGRVGQRCGSED